MKKGEEVKGHVARVRFGDRGEVITSEGERIQVKGVLPGQKVLVRILKKKAGSYKGMLLEVLEPAIGQTDSSCPHFPQCGGCTYRHYDEGLTEQMKEAQVKELLEPVLTANGIKGEEVWLSPLVPCKGEPYRNKMEYTFGDSYKGGPLELGLHKRGSFYDIVNVKDCIITHKDYGKITEAVLDFCREKGLSYYHKREHEGFLRHLLVRRTYFTDQILIGIVTTTQNEAPLAELKDRLLNLERELEGDIAGIIHIKNDSLSDVVKCDEAEILHGNDCFYEEISGLKFRIGLFSFFQTNSKGAEVLYDAARRILGDVGDAPVIYDLYSGTGTIAQMMAPVSKHVYGIEIVEEAVEAAGENASLNGLDNTTFIAGDVLKKLDEIPVRPDVIILDPPREGVHPKALSKITDYGVERILYISCKPTSLVNDLEAFFAAGYRVEKLQCVSMFPGTVHIETLCLLKK